MFCTFKYRLNEDFYLLITKYFAWVTVLFLLFLNPFNSIAQSKRLDSLKAQLRTTKNEKRVVLLNQISSSYFNFSADSGLNYALRAAKSATATKQYSELARAYSYAGQYFYYLSNYQASIASFKQSFDAAVQAKDQAKTIEAINNIANVQLDQGATNEAISRYKQVVELSKQYKDDKNLAIGYNNLGYTYRSIGDYKTATEYIIQKIRIDEKHQDKNGLAYGFQQLSLIYLQKKDYPNAKKYLDQSADLFNQLNDIRNLAVTQSLLSTYYHETKQKPAAISALKSAIALADKMKDKRSLAVFQSTLSGYLKENGQFEEAEKAYQKAILLHEQIGLKKTLSNVYAGYGQLLMSRDRYAEAKEKFDTALKLAEEQNSLADKRNAYEGLTDYYINQNDGKNATKFKQSFLSLKDSLLNEDNNKVINNLNIQYETERKEAALKLLASENALQESQLQQNKLQLFTNKLELDKKGLLLHNQNLELSNKNLLIRQNKTTLEKNKIDIKNKENQITLLNLSNELQKTSIQKRNILLAASLLLLIAVIAFGYLFYNRFKLKQESKLQAEIIQQQDLAAKAVINAEENERQRMSSTLHDGLGQLLSVVKMNFSALETELNNQQKTKELYDKTLVLIDKSIQEMRSVSHQMTVSNKLMRLGLGIALKSLVEQIDSRLIRVQLNIEGLGADIDQNIQLVMYRIFQESINNVIKHAKASHLDISISQEDQILHATIEDNGVGFDPAKLAAGKGIGLENIQTRINFLKGELDIDSQPGKGTLIAIHVPLS
jgi:signal transduction histidine kinase